MNIMGKGQRRLPAALTLVTLAACGGSGGGGAGAPATAPELSLTPQGVKTFHFAWTDVGGEAEYRLLEDADSTSGYTEVAAIAEDEESHDLEVFLPGRINARYILQACNAKGCVDSDPVSVGGSLADAVGYVKASNTEGGEWFGGKSAGFGTQGANLALSADGTTLAVGAISEGGGATGIDGDQSDNSAALSGAVYVFIHDDGAWAQQAYVKASNTQAGDLFGYSVALSGDGDTLAVGAVGEDSGAVGVDGNQADNGAGFSGAVYVFNRAGTTWAQQAYVKASNTEASDDFGYSVALSADGDTLAVGAFAEDSGATDVGGDQSSNVADGSGAVYVFSRVGTTWTQQAYVKASNTQAGDAFGSSVALSADGDTLAATADGEDSNGVPTNNSDTDSGAAYVFSRSGAIWSQQAYVKASETDDGDVFGSSIALSADGDILAVGAPGEDSNATGIDADEDDNSTESSGAAYVFSRAGTTWTQQAYVKASNTEMSDLFGTSVALSADGVTLAVGALGEGSGAAGVNGDEADNSASASGAVYVFSRSGGAWVQQAYVKASNAEADDGFNNVALSGDGTILAVGAYAEDGGATGLGGDQGDNSASGSGAVYLY